MELWMVALAILAGVIALFTPIPGNVIVAGRWAVKCWVFMLTAQDTKKPKLPPPKAPRVRGKRIKVVFIRHGESIWNCVMNRFGIGWPIRAVRYSLETLLLVLGNRNDSVIIDSPLSPKGELQAAMLAQYARSVAGRKMISHDPQTSIVVSSNLRRAMATAAIGLDSRIRENKSERIVIDSLLQEGSRNADAQSFMTVPRRLADAPVLGHQDAASLGALFDPSLNMGNKSRSSNMYKRIDSFALRIVGDGQDGLTSFPGAPTTIIAVGHSLWFKSFFNRYLPTESKHVSKAKKMKNCAAVSFDFIVDDQGTMQIDEATITALHLGFNK